MSTCAKKSHFWCAGWRFLFYMIEHTFWLDLILSVLLIGSGVVFWLDGAELFRQQAYFKFADIPLFYLVFVPILSGVLLLATMRCSAVSKGFARLISGFVWALAFVAYWQSYPPLNITMLVSCVFAIFAFITGGFQIMIAESEMKCKSLINNEIESGKAAHECKKKF